MTDVFTASEHHIQCVSEEQVLKKTGGQLKDSAVSRDHFHSRRSDMLQQETHSWTRHDSLPVGLKYSAAVLMSFSVSVKNNQAMTSQNVLQWKYSTHIYIYILLGVTSQEIPQESIKISGREWPVSTTQVYQITTCEYKHHGNVAPSYHSGRGLCFQAKFAYQPQIKEDCVDTDRSWCEESEVTVYKMCTRTKSLIFEDMSCALMKLIVGLWWPSVHL